MMHVIIVEDEASSAHRLEQFVKRYFAETGGAYTVKTYTDGLEFISEYAGGGRGDEGNGSDEADGGGAGDGETESGSGSRG